MRTVPEVIENIKNILNDAERMQDGSVLVEIDELANEILAINATMICAMERQKATWEDRSFKDRRLADEKVKAWNMAIKVAKNYVS